MIFWKNPYSWSSIFRGRTGRLKPCRNFGRDRQSYNIPKPPKPVSFLRKKMIKFNTQRYYSKPNRFASRNQIGKIKKC